MRAGGIARDMIVLRASPKLARWYIHGAAQNRRGTVLADSHTLGVPSFSPYRSGVLVAPSPTRPFAVSRFRLDPLDLPSERESGSYNHIAGIANAPLRELAIETACPEQAAEECVAEKRAITARAIPVGEPHG